VKISPIDPELIGLRLKKEITEGKIYTVARSASLPSGLNETFQYSRHYLILIHFWNYKQEISIHKINTDAEKMYIPLSAMVSRYDLQWCVINYLSSSLCLSGRCNLERWLSSDYHDIVLMYSSVATAAETSPALYDESQRTFITM